MARKVQPNEQLVQLEIDVQTMDLQVEDVWSDIIHTI
jgi:hypothetical protein